MNSFQAGTYINADRSTPGPGPERDASTTGESLSYRSLGPAHFSNLVSPEYPDGRRVYWTQGVNGLVKLDYDTYDMLAELPIATDPWTEPEGKAAINAIETAPAEQKPQLAANLLLDLYVKTNILTSSYAILDRDNHFFMGSPRGLAEYADADPTDPASPIVKVAEVTFPPEVTGTIVGMQITYDGYLVLATDTGYVIAVDRNGLKVVSTVALEHQSEGGPRWVRNSVTIDDEGGVYVVSNKYLHRVIWTGTTLTTDTAEGAWSEPYIDEGFGSGSSPQLMGWGQDCDRLVVIQDGQKKMNLAAYWRDDPPASWTPDPSLPSARMAGDIPVTAGDPDRDSTQSENAPTLIGYDAFVANQSPAVLPAGIAPAVAGPALSEFLGADPTYQPFGAQLIHWDDDRHAFSEGWSRSDISSPNSASTASGETGLIYTVIVEDGTWRLAAIRLTDGSIAWTVELGGPMYNSGISAVQLDPDGRATIGTVFGVVRVDQS